MNYGTQRFPSHFIKVNVIIWHVEFAR